MTIQFDPANTGDGSQDNQFNSGDASQLIQAKGDINGPVVAHGGIHIGDGNSGITITSVATTEQPKRTFDIAKKTRIPVPSSVIGMVSGLLAILSFATGAASLPEIVGGAQDGTPFTVGTLPDSDWYLLGSLLLLIAAVGLFAFWVFVRRHVLWLPKSPAFPAWAGLKEESGRTYPYALRLAMKCPFCTDRKLRFRRVPTLFNVVSDTRTGRILKRVPIQWTAMAVCTRYEQHNIPIDLADNDFDAPLHRR